MTKWPSKTSTIPSANSVFSPFSKQAKAWEPHGQSLRALAHCGPRDLLDPYVLAPKLGLTVMDGNTALNLLPPELQAYLRMDAVGQWSGGVLPYALPDDTFLCILNPAHPPRRNKITLMEEIAHRYMQHEPSTVVFDSDDVRARDFDRECETEAYGVGAAALLPWGRMFELVKAGQSVSHIADSFDVSQQLVQYRIKITGASVLYRSRQRTA